MSKSETVRDSSIKNLKGDKSRQWSFHLMLEVVDNVIGHETERIGTHMGLGRALNPMTGVSTRKERGIWTQKHREETHLDKVYVTRDKRQRLEWWFKPRSTGYCQRSPEAGRRQEGSSPRAFRCSTSHQQLDFRLLASRSLKEEISVVAMKGKAEPFRG